MSLSFPPYCTDEDIEVRASGDYLALCPKWQSLASGADGVFAPGSPWVLTSAGTDFQAQGLKPGNVVALTAPKPNFQGSGLLFGVASVSGHTLGLKQLGLDAGVGAPPGVPAGLTGVAFSVPTFQPQINSVCLDVNQQFGIDPNLASKSPALVYDPDLELTQCAVLTVLQRQYAMEVRAGNGDFALKLRQVETDLASLKDRMAVKWGPTGEGDVPKSLFSMRFRR